MNWTIEALRVGRLLDLPKEVISFKGAGEAAVSVPIIMFVVRSQAGTVIVDTGGPVDESRVVKYHGFKYAVDPKEHPEAALASIGLTPGDVDVVVNTHLHWDHSANNHLFTNAEHWVQRQELYYAIHPAPPNRATYEVLPQIKPLWLATLDRMRLADGDRELLPGLSLISLPGHSPGSQGVSVQTSDGTFLIAGDCVNTYENLEGNAAFKPRMSGGYTDMVAFTSSLERVQDPTWTVIPSHDHAVVEHRLFG